MKFDNYYLESSLYTDGRVDATVERLVKSGKTYEADGALWLKTTDYGDDKDRVMRKSDGGYTYFVPDVAYHVTKWERGFTTVINVQGSDHHSTITRVRAGLQATGIGVPAGYPDYVIHKMVTVMKGGEEVKISKRAGSYLTLRELIDEVGRDAVRFFLVSRKADSEFVFDIDLARSQTEANPVYYVQYAHARVASVMKQAGIAMAEAAATLADADLAPLASPYEEALLRRLAAFPAELAIAAREFAPHLVTTYLREMAADFHGYYNAERFLVDDPVTQRARLALGGRGGTDDSQRPRRARHQRAGQDVIATPALQRTRDMTSRTDRRPAPAAPAKRRSAASRKSGFGGTLLGLFIGIALGLALAAGVAYYLTKAGNPYQAATPGQEPPRDATKETGKPGRTEAGAAEKPRFDFYKILPGVEEPKVQPKAAERGASDKATVERAVSPDKADAKAAPKGDAKAIAKADERAASARCPRQAAREGRRRPVLAAGRLVREPERTPRT